MSHKFLDSRADIDPDFYLARIASHLLELSSPTANLQANPLQFSVAIRNNVKASADKDDGGYLGSSPARLVDNQRRERPENMVETPAFEASECSRVFRNGSDPLTGYEEYAPFMECLREDFSFPTYLDRYVKDFILQLCPLPALKFLQNYQLDNEQCKETLGGTYPKDSRDEKNAVDKYIYPSGSMWPSLKHEQIITQPQNPRFRAIFCPPEFLSGGLPKLFILHLCWSLFSLDLEQEVLSLLRDIPLLNNCPKLSLCKAKCLLRVGDYKGVIMFLASEVKLERLDHEMFASYCLVLGDSYEAIGARCHATSCYAAAITFNEGIFFSRKPNTAAFHSSYLTALEKLIGTGRLTSAEEFQLLQIVPWGKKLWSLSYHFYLKHWPFLGFPINSENSVCCTLGNSSSSHWGSIGSPESVKKLLQVISREYIGLPRGLKFSSYAAILLARSCFCCRHYVMAYESCEYALKKDPLNSQALIIKCKSMLLIPPLHKKLLHFSADLQRSCGSCALASFVAGCSHWILGKHLDAIACFTSGYSADQSFIDCFIGAGHVRNLRGDFEEAINSYWAAIRVQPSNYQLYLFLGMEELCRASVCCDEVTQMELLQKVQMYLSQALEICGTDPFLFNEFGFVAWISGNTEAAIKWFTRAVESSEFVYSDSQVFYCNLGHAMLSNGNPKGAVENFQKALSIERFDYDAWMGYGMALYQNGMESCIVAFEQAIAVGSSSTSSLALAVDMLRIAVEDRAQFLPFNESSCFLRDVMQLPPSVSVTPLTMNEKLQSHFIEHSKAIEHPTNDKDDENTLSDVLAMVEDFTGLQSVR